MLEDLCQCASDSRWRLREAVAMAPQHVGDVDFGLLLNEMRKWATGSCLEQRAAAAALCEPRLLTVGRVSDVLTLLDIITAYISQREDRRSEDFMAMRKGLGYCWSVAVAADPDAGRPAMGRWSASDDPDIRWIMRENLGKKRLQRMDPDWVERQLAALAIVRS